MGERRVCVVCGDAGVPMHRHHILGVAFVPDVWVWACAWPARNDCHGELTMLQRDCGVVLEHDAERNDAETVWTLLAGWAAILSVGARRSRDANADAALILRLASAAGLAVDEFAVRLGHPVIAGPDPRGAAVRAAARERKRAAGPTRARRLPGPHELGDEHAVFAWLLRAVADSLRRSVAADPACGVVIAQLDWFADHSSTLLANLAALDARGRLRDVISLAREHSNADRQLLLAIPALPDRGPLPPVLESEVRRAGLFTRAAWKLVGGLCTTDDPAALDDAVDGFLAAVAGLARAA